MAEHARRLMVNDRSGAFAIIKEYGRVQSKCLSELATELGGEEQIANKLLECLNEELSEIYKKINNKNIENIIRAHVPSLVNRIPPMNLPVNQPEDQPMNQPEENQAENRPENHGSDDNNEDDGNGETSIATGQTIDVEPHQCIICYQPFY